MSETAATDPTRRPTTAAGSAAGRVYIHEFIDIRGLHRADYIHHMTANWSPTAQVERNQLCFGVWPVIGSTGPWPQVINMWELEDWAGVAHGFALEGSGTGAYDPKLERWWAHAAEFRRGGMDRLVVPAPWNRNIDDLCTAGVSGVAYAHELVTTTPGGAHEFIERLGVDGLDVTEEAGLGHVGAFRTTMRNDDECILVWSIPDWPTWSAFEATADADTRLRAWRRSLDDLVTGWERLLMVDAPLSPFRTGRQPHVDDRIDWTD